MLEMVETLYRELIALSIAVLLFVGTAFVVILFVYALFIGILTLIGV